jgi:hypothetical protein
MTGLEVQDFKRKALKAPVAQLLIQKQVWAFEKVTMALT